MDFSGEWGLGKGQKLSMENLREVRDIWQEQAPPEAHENLSHPSGGGRGVGCGAGLGSSSFSHTEQLLCAPRTWGRGCQAGLGLVAQA